MPLPQCSRSGSHDMGRAQTQSVEDPDLAIADPQFHFDTESWLRLYGHREQAEKPDRQTRWAGEKSTIAIG
ncbi:MAG: DUF2333 family protein [Gammaproteobacteria bacterium]